MAKSMINFTHKGNFNNIERFITRHTKITPIIMAILHKYGKRGVEYLKEATPKDTGKTAESWTYSIEEDNGSYKIVWSNTNVADGWTNIAVLLQYGHATRNGGYVKGVDYINPAIEKVFNNLAEDAWKEVSHG